MKGSKIMKMGYLLYIMGVISLDEFQQFKNQTGQKKRDCSP